MTLVSHGLDGVWIAICDLDTDQDINLSQATACLTEAELARMNRFVFRHDQLRFARGRGFLRYSLADRLGVEAAQVDLDQGKNGKPFVRGSQIAFNLSHSQNCAVLAIADTGDIGIDIELSDRQFGKGTDLADLAKRCFTASEIDVFLSCDDADQQDRFLQFWTAKEARMKLWGEGMALDPKQIELDLKDGFPTGFKDAPNVGLHGVHIDHLPCICYLAMA